MTEIPNESIPFADIEDDDERLEQLRAMIEKQLLLTFEAKEIDEETYRRLSIGLCEINGDPFDWFTLLLLELNEAIEATILDKLVIADEFINEISSTDPRYEKVVAKYERLHERFRKSREWSA